jgi:hypothetical protein
MQLQRRTQRTCPQRQMDCGFLQAPLQLLDALGFYGCPKIPPADATVLPAVVVLKLVLNQLKQAAAHCVNGGLQVKGKDFNESYVHTIL